MYRAKSGHKLEKMSKQPNVLADSLVELENNELASVSVN
jgi:hypothetical protein